MTGVQYKIVDDNTITSNYVLGGKEVSNDAKELLPKVIKYYFERNLVAPTTESEKKVVASMSDKREYSICL